MQLSPFFSDSFFSFSTPQVEVSSGLPPDVFLLFSFLSLVLSSSSPTESTRFPTGVKEASQQASPRASCEAAAALQEDPAVP